MKRAKGPSGVHGQGKTKLQPHPVMNFVRLVMGQMDVITSNEIPLEGDEDFILLMLAPKAVSAIAFIMSSLPKGYTINNGYRIPNMRVY